MDEPTPEETPDDPFSLPDIDIPMVWRNRQVRATYHILRGDEEVALVRRRNQEKDTDVRVMLEGYLRLTYALLDFDGHDFRGHDFEAKLAYVSTWPTPLTDILIAQYTTAAVLPLLNDQETIDQYLQDQ